MANDFKFTVDDMVSGAVQDKIAGLVDSVTQLKHGYSVSDSMTAMFRGANILGNAPIIKQNTNNLGYVFTTRPDLNFSTDNLKIERKLMPLLTTTDASIMRAIRILLSPRMGGVYPPNSRSKPTPISCPLINPYYPFLSISDNSVMSLTGWPSSQLGIQESNPDVMHGTHIMADGPMRFNETYSLSLSTFSMKGNPVMYLYFYWILYIGYTLYQTYGVMPWPEYLANGRLDYTSRIYRFIMDESRTYITEVAATGYAIPRSIDMGPIFDYNRENPRPYAEKNTEVEFICSGAMYLDEIVLRQFNETVYSFNPNLKDARNRNQFYVKIPKELQALFNTYCYPLANFITRELEWWVPKDIYNKNKEMVKMAGAIGR